MKRVLEHLLPLTTEHNIPIDAVTTVYACHFPGIKTDEDAAAVTRSLSDHEGEDIILDMKRTSVSARALPGVCGYRVFFTVHTAEGARQGNGFIPVYRSVENR